MNAKYIIYTAHNEDYTDIIEYLWNEEVDSKSDLCLIDIKAKERIERDLILQDKNPSDYEILKSLKMYKDFSARMGNIKFIEPESNKNARYPYLKAEIDLESYRKEYNKNRRKNKVKNYHGRDSRWGKVYKEGLYGYSGYIDRKEKE